MRRHLRFLLSVVAALALLPVAAQTDWSPERSGGVYYAYPDVEPTDVVVPVGYDVFYVSHYGRHGSRWLPDEERYDWVWAQFADKKNLTREGLEVRKKLRSIVRNARGRAGQLTPLGARQHRAIAGRMADRFPQLFRGADARLSARSSTSPRCRASMLAFCDELERRFPGLEVDVQTNEADMAWINHEPAELQALKRRVVRQADIAPDRFVAQLFRDPARVGQPLKLLSELHTIASDMQDVPLSLDLFQYMTREEMEAVHDANDLRMNLCNGPSPLNDGIAARAGIALWQHIADEADDVIRRRAHGASLRFGHDTALFRLMTLMGLTTGHDRMEDLLPMAANLQLVFARNAAGDVRVAILHNELMVSDFEPWTAMKERIARRIHSLEHLRQLAALNTMVGTAPANTRTAGLFGKGSEEHGQTLPAVLTPNGQTFWTPQTRDTEKKCVAPYYYTDSLLQGIRASHWLVGGCTQDYGSFTLAALTGRRRLAPEERTTRFSHTQETSHPYYYKVYLPDEQLLVELTALSHSAIMRVTPLQDGPVHIVLNTNSDEREGGVELDRRQRMVYAYNPVHRIYQGWGERAGFSGHFVLTYTDEIADFCTFDEGVCLTMNGHRGRPIELRMATSFTSREGALGNLERRMTFDEMMQTNIDRWTRRLHTIDVDDPDTARVLQFYGALYRASFLPREMSDKDGRYPKFGAGQLSTLNSQLSTHYCDFSMWDTYRALHPLYNIIVPDVSGQMMQSLVRMYEEGGWMPIFPCWNSYTAAMIGDHCASVLADACVKGITGVDYAKAYEGLRKNAMESPATFEEYKNGMGRRALASYLKYGYIPLEDSVMEAFHTHEQTSRTLEYAYDDFCVAQLARALGHDDDYRELMRRSENWRHVINPLTGWADGRHADGSWEGNTDLVHRKPYITEGATCHYTWYVPQNVPGLISRLGGEDAFTARLDSMFTCGRYWHGNEPCHQVAWLYALAGQPAKTRQWVSHILQTEYNDTPGGLSGNDDAGQMSAWQLFAMMGFYPVCPGTTDYVLGAPAFRRVTLNQPSGRTFTIGRQGDGGSVFLNGQPHPQPTISHADIVRGGTLEFK